MKAIILAAGEGRRLLPLTRRLPKCLMPINGRPLIAHWLEKCEAHRIEEVLINGHYMASLLEAFLERARMRYSVRIRYVYEPRLLGTGGTVRRNADFVQDETAFLLCHGDNFTNIDLTAFAEFHRKRGAELSIALFRTDTPEQCGIVEQMEPDGRIDRFVEKPPRSTSNLASAAIFLMSPRVINAFPDREIVDISRDVLPLYQGRMHGFMIDGYNIDIGTLDRYRLANRIASSGVEATMYNTHGPRGRVSTIRRK